MRSATLWVGVAVVVTGCASSRQEDPTAGVSRAAAPVKYENTVTNYFDITSRTPPAQRKLQFDPPETTNCRILASSGGHLGWVVPVTYEITAAPRPPAAAAAPSKAELPVQGTKGAPTPAKGKAAAKTAKAAPAPSGAAIANPSGAAAGATAAALASAGPDVATATLDNVSVTGKTRYFFWFDRETINAVTKRMDICP